MTLVDLFRQHPDGLSPMQVRDALKLEKDMADTLRHIARDGILKRMETGRYAVAGGNDDGFLSGVNISGRERGDLKPIPVCLAVLRPQVTAEGTLDESRHGLVTS